NKPVVAKVNASSSTPSISPDVSELKDMVKALWKWIFTKRRKTKPKTTKLGTEWKSVKRRSQIEAKKSIKSKSQQKSQTVKVKVNPDKVKVSSEKLK
ncbi:hypothetical protein Tco_0329886, partial [Tanacetum coccineum]